MPVALALFLLFVMGGAWWANPALAQVEKKEPDPTSQYRGTEYERKKGYQGTNEVVNPERRVKTKREQKEDASMVASYSGQIKYKDLKLAKAKSSQKFAEYSGSIPLRKVRRMEERREISNDNQARYSGNVPFIDFKARRQQMASKMARFRGPVAIRIKKKPKGSSLANYRGAPNQNRRPANYNRSNLRSGRKVKKEDLPNYAKTPRRKLRYDSREVKMWREGGDILPKVQERKLPKPSKKAKSHETETEMPAEQP
ncbi:MAG: hypothetical protein HC913_00905 [Microscillaceae bacterium]|nr:hypothetical protein [Microscillaceae bacterium]